MGTVRRPIRRGELAGIRFGRLWRALHGGSDGRASLPEFLERCEEGMA